MEIKPRILWQSHGFTIEALGRRLELQDISVAFIKKTPNKSKMPRHWVSLREFPEKTMQDNKLVCGGLPDLPQISVSAESIKNGFIQVQLQVLPPAGLNELHYEGHRFQFRYNGQEMVNNHQSYAPYNSFTFSGVLPELYAAPKWDDGAPRISKTEQAFFRERKGVAWWWTALKAEYSQESLFLGALSARHLKTTFVIHKEETGHSVFVFQGLQGDYLPMNKGPRAADPLLINIGDHILKTMDHYGEIVADHQPPLEDAHASLGWSSWYEHYKLITREVILTAAEQARQKLAPHGLTLFQIDDGYAVKNGDWPVLKEEFPDSMGETAAQIRHEGLQPAVWLAPYLVEKDSNLAQSSPADWFLSGHDGENVVYSIPNHSQNYILDVTHPDVQAWLRNTIRMFVDWGYSELKLDFLFLQTAQARRFNPQISEMEAYNLGLEIIRAEAGEKVRLLLSGSISLAAIGLGHAHRTGPDIAYDIFGGGTRKAFIKAQMSATAAHFFTGHRWYTPNADAVMLREPLSDSLAEVMMAQAAMTGGDFIISDDLSRVSESRMSRCLDPKLLHFVKNKGHLIPLDYFEPVHSFKIMPNPLMLESFYSVPKIWIWRDRATEKMFLFLFNLKSEPVTISRDLNDLSQTVYGALFFTDGSSRDIFHNDELVISEGRISFKMSPESVRIFPL